MRMEDGFTFCLDVMDMPAEVKTEVVYDVHASFAGSYFII